MVWLCSPKACSGCAITHISIGNSGKNPSVSCV